MSNDKEILLEIIEDILIKGRNDSSYIDNNHIDYNLSICYLHILKEYDAKIFVDKSKLYCIFEDYKDGEKQLIVYQIDGNIEKLYFNRIRDLKLNKLGI